MVKIIQSDTILMLFCLFTAPPFMVGHSLCIRPTREGNDNPLQCSCPENPRDGRAGGLLSMGSHRVGHD